MNAHHPAKELAVVLGGLSSGRGLLVEPLLRIVPTLAEGTLDSATLALRTGRGLLAIVLRLADQPRTGRALQRLAFWFAREGGWIRATDQLDATDRARLAASIDGSEPLLRDVPAAEWDQAVRLVLDAAGVPPPGDLSPEPELRLHPGGRSWDGFAFDAAAGLLQIPCPLSPPAGDVMRIVIEGQPAGRGTVVAVRRSAGASPLAPAGFTLALEGIPQAAVDLLVTSCRDVAVPTTRRAPRYPVIAPAVAIGSDEELRYESGKAFLSDYVTNLSHGGAFVRTRQRRAIGDLIGLRVALPTGESLLVHATVVHRTDDGVGLQFELTPAVEAALSGAIASLAGRPRRVLLVDDDALCRQLLADAFQQRGFEVLTATQGEAGLRAITDELFALDAVVTDVLMPGLSGEELVSAVRTAGGESDLILVVVSGAADAELTARLALAGADRVLSKDLGPDTVIAAVEEALALRAAPPATPDPFLPQQQVPLEAAAR